jgi:F-box-like
MKPPSSLDSCGPDAVVFKNDGERPPPNENGAPVHVISSLEIPDEVYALIAVFLPDAKSACRCAQVCRAFYKAVMKDELWTTLAAQKWHWSPLSNRVDCLDTITTVTVTAGRFKSIPIATTAMVNSCSTYPEYQRRHELDKTVATVVQEISEWLTVPGAMDSVLQICMRYFDFGGPNESSNSPGYHWGRLTSLLVQSHDENDGTLQARVTPLQILDSLCPFLLRNLSTI